MRRPAVHDCRRCGFTFPRHEFPVDGHVRLSVCRDCSPTQFLAVHLMGQLARLRMMTVGAQALLALGLPEAAAVVLNEYRVWPDLEQARQMRRSAA